VALNGPKVPKLRTPRRSTRIVKFKHTMSELP
jgi:hypothetical protein